MNLPYLKNDHDLAVQDSVKEWRFKGLSLWGDGEMEMWGRWCQFDDDSAFGLAISDKGGLCRVFSPAAPIFVVQGTVVELAIGTTGETAYSKASSWRISSVESWSGCLPSGTIAARTHIRPPRRVKHSAVACWPASSPSSITMTRSHFAASNCS